MATMTSMTANWRRRRSEQGGDQRSERRGRRDERGTTTAEYAIGTLAACAFAAVLYKILTGGSVAAALGGLIHRALGVAG
jgi:Flp pilus assembly pilin Flp